MYTIYIYSGPQTSEYANIKQTGAQALQYVLDSLILFEEGSESDKLETIQIPMKTGEYKEDQMTTLLGFILPFFFIIASMIPQQVTFGRIMHEKVYIYIIYI